MNISRFKKTCLHILNGKKNHMTCIGMCNRSNFIFLRTQKLLIKQASRKSKKKKKNIVFQEAKHLIAEHKLNQSDIIYVTHCYVGVFFKYIICTYKVKRLVSFVIDSMMIHLK